jgi:hypothetical protein
MFILAQAEETDLFEYKSDLKKKNTLYMLFGVPIPDDLPPK